MSDRGRIAVLVVVGTIVALAIVSLIYVSLGVGPARGQSQYSGHVTDVVEDKGMIWRPSWVNMKTDPRSSDIQQFCIHPLDEDRLLERFYDAMETGERVTITYDRPVWVSPSDCASDQSIVSDVRPVNASG